MSILSWNCRGLGNPGIVQELCDFVRTKSPHLVFLCETKCNSATIDRIKARLNMFGVSVPARGRSGGLACLWSKNCTVTLQAFSDIVIDLHADIHDNLIRATGVYEEPSVLLRSAAWNAFRDLASPPGIPWIYFGDFNEVLIHLEIEGNNIRAEWQINSFRNALQACGLQDMGV